MDRADLAGLEDLLSRAVREGLKERYEKVLAARACKPDDVAAGRAYVAAYVEFLQYAERLPASATQDAPGHHGQE